jgi:PAS domain S-box-containing protein
MSFDTLILPSQAVVPLLVALGHLTVALIIVFRRRFRSNVFPHIFVAYLVLTILWDVNLVIVVLDRTLEPMRNSTWLQFVTYGLVGLGMLFWVFDRAFLGSSWSSPWARVFRVIGLVILAITISLNMAWITLPAGISTLSTGWVDDENAAFVLGAGGWWLFIGLTLVTTVSQLVRTPSPAHKNRIQYLLIGTILLAVGYGMFLSLAEPLWTTGLIITWLANVLTGYIVTVENLIDLGTGMRRVVSRLVIVAVTVVIYIAGIYMVQILLGDFLASTFLARLFNPVLLVAVVTAVLLTIVYGPVTKVSRSVADRLLFGRHYDFQTVIKHYTQSISNILYLDELANVALSQIKQILGIEEGLLFLRDFESDDQFHFRILPMSATEQGMDAIVLTKNTPIVNRLVDEGKPLAQYSVDISPQFKGTPEEERQALKDFNFEWFVPILKKQELVGIFALGPKISGRPYSNQDIHLLNTLSDQTALALDNAGLVDRLQHNFKEISRMKNLMDNVFDSMDSGVITTDLADKITFFNKAAESILGLPPASYSIGRPYTQVLPSLVKSIFPNLVANVIKREQHYLDYELIFQVPNRGRVNLNMNLAPLRDAYNQTQGVTMVMDDLTETKRLEAVQDMFRRYVSPAVVDRLPGDPSELQLGGHRQEISVLFADIRGFTTFSERLEPEQLVDVLNEYLSIAAGSILMHDGTLDKFMGDAVMGIFNAPLEQDGHVLLAVQSALAMQKSIVDYHQDLDHERGLSFGIGIHMGEAVVGNVGMSDRMDYTAVGDTVNLAKRIQENTPANKILVSEEVFDQIKSSVRAKFFKKMKVKGREQPVKTFELVQLELSEIDSR